MKLKILTALFFVGVAFSSVHQLHAQNMSMAKKFDTKCLVWQVGKPQPMQRRTIYERGQPGGLKACASNPNGCYCLLRDSHKDTVEVTMENTLGRLGTIERAMDEARLNTRDINKSVRDFIGTFNVYIKKTLTQVIKSVMATAIKEIEKAKKKG